jgi:hypothetical protein
VCLISQCLIETLEHRVLLAGDVTVRVVRGNLEIRGDNAAQNIILDQNALSAGLWCVTAADATLINGVEGPLITAPVAHDVIVDLRGGDDALSINSSACPRDLRVNTGRGADSVAIVSSTVAHVLAISSRVGAGARLIIVNGTTVDGKSLIRTGFGADTITIDGSTFGNDIVVATGKGRDNVSLPNSVFRGRVHLDVGHDEDIVAAIPQPQQPVTESFDFANGAEGWIAGFSDYLPDNEIGGNSGSDYNLDAGIRPLPAELNAGGTGFLLAGSNTSDDLFMYLKRGIDQAQGIVPGETYFVTLTITFASNAPTGAIGAGGPPGEAVLLKAGATPVEPRSILGSDGHVKLNVPKTDDSPETAASVVGNIANGLTLMDPNGVPYVSLTQIHTHVTSVTADSRGRLWLLMGTDSGFEGRTTIYYQRIAVTLTPASHR